MSADVWLQIDTGGPEPTSVTETRTLTYNLTPMLRAAGFCGWQELMGQNAAESEPMLMATGRALRADPARFKAMNPENGWGDYEQAIDMMEELALDARKHPKAHWGGWL